MPEEQQSHIIVVDDEPVTRALLKGHLAAAGFQVSEAENAQVLERLLASVPTDLILLDINMPGKDGLTVARELRARSDIGIILVTHKSDDIDRIVGLEIGADDYVPKPFHPRELVARVKTVLRRVQAARAVADESPVLRFDGWSFDLLGRTLTTPEGEQFRLPGGEYNLLATLVQHPGKVLSRERLADLVNPRSTATTQRSVDVLIGRLRRKLGDDPKNPRLIATVHGAGYVFTAHPH